MISREVFLAVRRSCGVTVILLPISHSILAPSNTKYCKILSIQTNLINVVSVWCLQIKETLGLQFVLSFFARSHFYNRLQVESGDKVQSSIYQIKLHSVHYCEKVLSLACCINNICQRYKNHFPSIFLVDSRREAYAKGDGDVTQMLRIPKYELVKTFFNLKKTVCEIVGQMISIPTCWHSFRGVEACMVFSSKQQKKPVPVPRR